MSELTLDPQNWEDFRALAHRMIDDMISHLSTLDSQPVWTVAPEQVRAALDKPVPYVGQGMEKTYRDFQQYVLPYSLGTPHPRFWGWVQGSGAPFAMLADMLASGMNTHMGGFNQTPAVVERQVVAWLAELMGLPHGSGGVFESGGTMANILGLAVARHVKAGYDVRESGLRFGPDLAVYCSTETHSWAQRGVELLGMGNRSLRRIAVNREFQMDVKALEAAIVSDRAVGMRPIAVIGTAGTVNTGACDDLAALADLCERHALWFHVDGAFGALLAVSAKHRHLVKGMECADSMAFDLHKWMSMPFECAVTLVRDDRELLNTFALAGDYLRQASRGPSAGGLYFSHRGVDLTRGFKALKAWMSLKAYGVMAFAALVEQNIDQVQHLVRVVAEYPELEMVAPAPLNVACFRYVGGGGSAARLNQLNEELLVRLQESGEATPSNTVINGKYSIRVANVNHRSKLADFDRLVTAVLKIGREVSRAFPA